MDYLDRLHARSTWTKENTSGLTKADLKSIVGFTQWSKTGLTDPAKKAMRAHYGVETVEELLKKHSANDRDRIMQLHASKERGNTEQVHQIVERAWGAKGDVDQRDSEIVVEVDSEVTTYKDVIYPVTTPSKLGLANLGHVLACIAFVSEGYVEPIRFSETFPEAYKKSVLRVSKIPSYIAEVAKMWVESENTRMERDAKKTFRGLDCVSIFTRFLTGLPIPQYMILHSAMCTELLNLFVTGKNGEPTDEWRKVLSSEGKMVPVNVTTSVKAVFPTAKGEWGSHSEIVTEKYKYTPKLLVGPVKIVTNWIESDAPTVKSVRAAVIAAINIRGGDKSYWSRSMACTEFSVATPYVNRMRLLTALAVGVLETPDSVVQIAVEACDLDIVLHSLKSTYDDKRIKFLVDATTKVKLGSHVHNKNILCVSDPKSVLVAINDLGFPQVAKGVDCEAIFEESMTRFLETIQHEKYCVFSLVMGKNVFNGRVVVAIRPPYDMRAVVTTDERFVQAKFFPKVKRYNTFQDFGKAAIIASADSLTHIFSPLRVRSKSIELLNILKFPITTAKVKINKETGNWECAAFDDSHIYEENDFEAYDVAIEKERNEDKNRPKKQEEEGDPDGGTGTDIDLEGAADEELGG